MNRQDRGIVVGMSLGDGYLTKYRKRRSSQIYMGHSLKQSQYLQYKVDLLNKIFGGKATVRYNEKFCYANKSNAYFKVLRGMLYKNGTKYFSEQILNMLTPEGIAIWFMDDGSHRVNLKQDGSVGSYQLTLSTYCSLEEAKNIHKYFFDNYGIDFKIKYCKKTQKYTLLTNTKMSQRLALLIEPYIVPTMSYKIACVCYPERHETPKPVECANCKQIFLVLRAKGLCTVCYNKQNKQVMI